MPRGCQKTNETVNETVNDTATRQVPDKYPTSTRQVPDKLRAHLIILSRNTCLQRRERNILKEKIANISQNNSICIPII